MKQKRAKEGKNSKLAMWVSFKICIQEGQIKAYIGTLKNVSDLTTPSSSSQFLYRCVRSVNSNTGHYVLVQYCPFKDLPYVQLTLLKRFHATELHNLYLKPVNPIPQLCSIDSPDITNDYFA